MKLLKICGAVAGIHLFVLLFIFANPGCSSTTPPPVAPDATAKTDTPPPITVPSTASSPTAPGGAGNSAVTFDPAAALSGAGRSSPTRPGTAAASAIQRQPVADVTPASTYVVASGDTLSGVAKKNHLTAKALADANNIKATAALHVGQKLIIPVKLTPATKMEVAAGGAAASTMPPSGADTAAARTSGDSVKHVVKAGETLERIARKYGVKQGDIAVANNISDPAKIRIGMELTIPSSTSTAKSPRGSRSATSAAAASAQAPASSTPAPVGPGAATPPEAESDSTQKTPPPVIKVDEADAPAK